MSSERPAANTSTSPRTMPTPAAAVLWASAFVIAALVIVQAGRLPANPAHAQMVTSANDYTIMTTESGRSDYKVLYVIDNRRQVLLTYEVEDARRGLVHLQDGGRLENLFRTARR